MVDADYKFLYVDIGYNGRTADGGVFKNSDLYTALENKALNIPSPKPIKNEKEYIQKPYSQVGLTTTKRIFNYRLSRARRIVENAFGILSNRFRVFMTPVRLAPEKVETVVLACCSLHNFLRSRQGSRCIYTPPGCMDTENGDTHRLTPGDWHSNGEPRGLIPMKKQGSNHYSTTAKAIRDYLCDYFISEDGAVPWQNDMI